MYGGGKEGEVGGGRKREREGGGAGLSEDRDVDCARW